MKQVLYETYQDYVDAQTKLTRRKISVSRVRSFTVSEVVLAVKQDFFSRASSQLDKSNVLRLDSSRIPVKGLCHGVRLGKELDMYEQEMGGSWVGTEITPELCDGVRIFNYDFSTVPTEWIGRFDVVYSNSFDHSRDPWVTIKAWLALLSPVGRLYIEWTAWHDKLGSADCLAMNDKECLDLFSAAGRVEDCLLVQGEDQVLRKIFVVR